MLVKALTMMTGQKAAVNKYIYQLEFMYKKKSLQPATTASGFDRKATRNPQLYIAPSIRLFKNLNYIMKNSIFENV